MSTQQIAKFFQATLKDEALTEKIKAATSPSMVVAIAAQYGYKFTEDELLQFELERRQTEGMLEDLSDEQLEAVAGGSYYFIKTFQTGTCCIFLGPSVKGSGIIKEC